MVFGAPLDYGEQRVGKPKRRRTSTGLVGGTYGPPTNPVDGNSTPGAGSMHRGYRG